MKNYTHSDTWRQHAKIHQIIDMEEKDTGSWSWSGAVFEFIQVLVLFFSAWGMVIICFAEQI